MKGYPDDIWTIETWTVKTGLGLLIGLGFLLGLALGLRLVLGFELVFRLGLGLVSYDCPPYDCPDVDSPDHGLD